MCGLWYACGLMCGLWFYLWCLYVFCGLFCVCGVVFCVDLVYGFWCRCTMLFLCVCGMCVVLCDVTVCVVWCFSVLQCSVFMCVVVCGLQRVRYGVSVCVTV